MAMLPRVRDKWRRAEWTIGGMIRTCQFHLCGTVWTQANANGFDFFFINVPV
jgi:hypothetical protein